MELFVVHPTMAVAEITASLGLEPQHTHQVDDPRRTPKGTSSPGNYPDTRWRFSRRCEVRGQWFERHVAEFADSLAPHKDFLCKVRSTGGTACIVIQFLGDGYFGDKISRETMAKLLGLELDLAIEIYPKN